MSELLSVVPLLMLLWLLWLLSLPLVTAVRVRRLARSYSELSLQEVADLYASRYQDRRRRASE